MKTSPAHLLRSLARGEDGNELVEFALAAVILLMTIFGIVDCSRALYAYHFASYAAQEGTRYAITRGADWPSSCSTSAPPNFTLTYSCKAGATDIQNYVQSLAPAGITASLITMNTTTSFVWPGTTPDCTTTPCSGCSSKSNNSGCYVRVKVSYPFSFSLPFLPTSPVTMTATSQKVIQY